MTKLGLNDCDKVTNNSKDSTDLSNSNLTRHSIPSQVSSDNITKFSINSIRISQYYKQIAPEMTQNELHALKQSIKQHGLYYPLVVNNEGILLDGHHRYEVCQMLGLEPRIEVRIFTDKLQEKLFICESAAKRRNLSDWQKVNLAITTERLLKEIAKQNRFANLKQNQAQNRKKQLSSRPYELVGDVAKTAAKSAGLSATTYKRARTIIEKGTEDQKQRLMLGKSKINKEYTAIRRQEKIDKLINESLNYQFPLPDQINLICGDFKIVSAQIPDNFVDLILTDPPYHEESLSLYRDLALLAGRKLKQGGSIVSFYGDRLLRKFRDYLEKDAGLIENCTLHIKLQGSFARDYDRGIVRKQKPMLWYYKGPHRQNTGELLEDLIDSETPDKVQHIWQQSHVESYKIISRLTVQNQVIFDPMMGTGTNASAALVLKRKFVGIEIDPNTYEIARSKVIQAQKSILPDSNVDQS